LQYGVYGKLKFGKLELMGRFRMSEFFDSSKKFAQTGPLGLPQNTSVGGGVYPLISAIQVGLFLDWN
jgi:hypothetical protein